MRRWVVALVFVTHVTLTVLFLALTLTVQGATAVNFRAMIHTLRNLLYPKGFQSLESDEADASWQVYDIVTVKQCHTHANVMLSNYFGLVDGAPLTGRIIVGGGSGGGGGAGRPARNITGLNPLPTPTISIDTYIGLNQVRSVGGCGGRMWGNGVHRRRGDAGEKTRERRGGVGALSPAAVAACGGGVWCVSSL